MDSKNLLRNYNESSINGNDLLSVLKQIRKSVCDWLKNKKNIVIVKDLKQWLNKSNDELRFLEVSSLSLKMARYAVI